MSTLLKDAVVVVTGASGSAGPATARRLAGAGATVVLAGRSLDRLEPLVAQIASDDAARAGGATRADGRAHPFAVDLLDEAATASWAAGALERFGRVDGVVHLVGGWRGGKGIVEADLADWEWLSNQLVRTTQHVSRAFHDALLAAPAGRFAIVSAVEASRPTAKNASYAAAKAAAEAWTLAVADSFRESRAAATILVVRALVTPAMRRAKPAAAFAGFTDVEELAGTILRLWDRDGDEINGERLWLTN